MTIEPIQEASRSSIPVYENLESDEQTSFCRFLLCSCQDLYQSTVQSIAEELSRTGCHFSFECRLIDVQIQEVRFMRRLFIGIRCLDGAVSPDS